jgi:hypothetical protein
MIHAATWQLAGVPWAVRNTPTTRDHSGAQVAVRHTVYFFKSKLDAALAVGIMVCRRRALQVGAFADSFELHRAPLTHFACTGVFGPVKLIVLCRLLLKVIVM